MVSALVNMEMSGCLGMTVCEYQPSNPGYVFACGFFLWLKSILVPKVRSLDFFSHGKLLSLSLPFCYDLVIESGVSSDSCPLLLFYFLCYCIVVSAMVIFTSGLCSMWEMV